MKHVYAIIPIAMKQLANDHLSSNRYKFHSHVLRNGVPDAEIEDWNFGIEISPVSSPETATHLILWGDVKDNLKTKIDNFASQDPSIFAYWAEDGWNNRFEVLADLNMMETPQPSELELP